MHGERRGCRSSAFDRLAFVSMPQALRGLEGGVSPVQVSVIFAQGRRAAGGLCVIVRNRQSFEITRICEIDAVFILLNGWQSARMRKGCAALTGYTHFHLIQYQLAIKLARADAACFRVIAPSDQFADSVLAKILPIALQYDSL